jgi:hypothetical protein
MRSLLLGCSCDEAESINMVRSFSKIKGSIIDQSIMMNGQLILFPEMMSAMIKDIVMSQKLISIKESFGVMSSGICGDNRKVAPVNNTFNRKKYHQ